MIKPTLDQASGWVEGQTSGVVTAARIGVNQRWQKTESSLEQRGGRTTPGRQELQTHVKQMISQAGDGKLGEASYEFLAVLQAGRRIWNDWWNDNDDGQE